MFLIALLDVSMFVHHPQEFLFMYAKVTKCLRLKHLYTWLLQVRNRLQPLKHRKICQQAQQAKMLNNNINVKLKLLKSSTT